MIILPLLFNIIQFWVQDNILKGKRHYIDSSLITDKDLELSESEQSLSSIQDYTEL